MRRSINDRLRALERAVGLEGISREIQRPTCFHRQIAEPIIQAVCDAFGVNRQAVMLKSRETWIVEPRMAAMNMVRKRTRLSLEQIASVFEMRDHGTVLNAVRRADELREIDRNYNEAMSRAESVLDGKQEAVAA